MDRSLATREVPLLNRGEPYIPEAGRTMEDDVALTYDAKGTIRERTHMSARDFERIYNATMKYFTVQEKYLFKQYQSGEKKPEHFYEEAGKYLKRTFPTEMSKEWDYKVMMNRLNLAMFQYDVIRPLIDNKDTSDIKICGPYDIRVRVKGKAYKSNATFIDEQDLFRFVDGLAIRNRVDIWSHPVITFTDQHDPNYIMRFTVSSPTVCAVDYPYLHIRKVPKTKPFFDDLIKAGMLNEDVKLYLIDRAKLSRGIVFAGPPGCVDKDTEFFNGKEWKSIADYKEGEKVLQYDTNTGEATLVKPLAYIKKRCNKMYHFETKYGIDQTLSPEHRVLYYNRSTKGGTHYSSVKEMSCKELAEKQNIGKFHGKFKTDFKYSGKGVNLSDAEIELMLAVIADGHFDNRKKNSNNKRCVINLKKERKQSLLREILKRTGITYSESIYKDGVISFTFQAPRREKEFSSFWYNCNAHQLQLIIENICKWDGRITEKNEKYFFTTSRISADFIQFVFSSCGYRGRITVSDRKGKKQIKGKDEYVRKSTDYIVYAGTKTMVGMDWHKGQNNTFLQEVKPKDGYKYCFTVPTHALVLRRNGNIFITGNSGKSTALNAFIEHVPKTRETLVIQENDELHTKQSGFMFKHVTHGFHGEQACSLEDLAKMALVEGCNEFIIGEVKGGEMRYAMTLVNAGGYAALTVHSTNAYETLDKLADLVKYGSSYTFEEARRMLKTFDTIVYMEGYKIREILENEGYDDETKQFKYVNIYRYDPSMENKTEEEEEVKNEMSKKLLFGDGDTKDAGVVELGGDDEEDDNNITDDNDINDINEGFLEDTDDN